MAQQGKESSQPYGFAGFEDLISDISEDLVAPSPKAKQVTPAPAAPVAAATTSGKPTSPHAASPNRRLFNLKLQSSRKCGLS